MSALRGQFWAVNDGSWAGCRPTIRERGSVQRADVASRLVGGADKMAGEGVDLGGMPTAA